MDSHLLETAFVPLLADSSDEHVDNTGGGGRDGLPPSETLRVDLGGGGRVGGAALDAAFDSVENSGAVWLL